MSIVLHMRRKSQKNQNESEHEGAHESASATNGNAVDNETKENSSSISSTSTSASASSSASTSPSLALALIKRICEQAPDRALPRSMALNAVLAVISKCVSTNTGIDQLLKVRSLLAKFTRSKKTSQRLFAVELCIGLLLNNVAADNHTTNNTTNNTIAARMTPGAFVNGADVLLAAISARLEDRTPKLRAKGKNIFRFLFVLLLF